MHHCRKREREQEAGEPAGEYVTNRYQILSLGVGWAATHLTQLQSGEARSRVVSYLALFVVSTVCSSEVF